MVQTFLQVAAGAADSPVTRLLGQSPAGLSATGDSDTRNTYDMIAARQAIDLRPQLERLDRILLRSAGVDPANVSFDFRPLWQMDAASAAAIALQKAQATQIYAGLNLWPNDVTARLVESQLIEDGVFPGAEAIFGAAKAAGVVADRGGSGHAASRAATDVFNPAQLRDPNGRWTAGGGAGAAAVVSAGALPEVQTASEVSPQIAAASASTPSADPDQTTEPSDDLSRLGQAVSGVLSAIDPIGPASAQVGPALRLLSDPRTLAAIVAAANLIKPYISKLGQEIYQHLPSWPSGTTPEPKPTGPASSGAAPQGAKALPADGPPGQQNSVVNPPQGGYASESPKANEKPGQQGKISIAGEGFVDPDPEKPEDANKKKAQEQKRKNLEDAFEHVKKRYRVRSRS
jgi:hypothetical protein